MGKKARRSKGRERTVRDLSEGRIDEIIERVRAGKRVRRTLPGGGRLHLDRQLPFLVVYRIPPDRADAFTARLVTGESAYLVAPGDPEARRWLDPLVTRLVETLSAAFGAFLLVEVWTTPESAGNDPMSPDWSPELRIVARQRFAGSRTVHTLREGLRELVLEGHPVRVRRSLRETVAPPALDPLLTDELRERTATEVVGLAFEPFFRAPTGTTLLATLDRKLRRGLAHALRPALFRFVKERTTQQPPHFHALGRRAMVRAVWRVDQALWSLANSMDFLLWSTPVDSESRWKQFRATGFEEEPTFRYRPLTGSITERKRALHSIAIEKVEDPTLADLFEAKRRELDRKLTMLEDRGTPAFLYGSLGLYGPVEPSLLATAEAILRVLPTSGVAGADDVPVYDAATFAEHARAAIADYARQDPTFAPKVKVTRTVPGLMASRGSLLVARSISVKAPRVEASIEHEIGTHLLTHHNGNAQPFKLLRSGLPGYESMQEGLAVLSEFLVGGLDPARLRTLAARVVAVDHLCRGASFRETFEHLRSAHGVKSKRAYSITMRVFRGGGFTKDAIYLRGFVRLLEQLARGEDLALLFSGRFGEEQIGIVEELVWRKVLEPAPLRPRYLDRPDVVARLERVRAGVTVEEIAREAAESRD